METSQLLQELISKDKHEIQSVLVALMLKEKISFIEVNSAYIESLKVINEFNKEVLAESAACIISSTDPNLNKFYSIDRNIYLLDNHLKYFNIVNLKKRLKYDEDNGKRLCQITNKL